MSWLSRITNVFRRDRLTREIDEELESHIAEAIEQGRRHTACHFAAGPYRTHIRDRRSDGTPARAVRFRLDVQLVRLEARAWPSSRGERRCDSRSERGRSSLVEYVEPPLCARPEHHW